MDSMSISRFKATCLEVLARVKRTGEPILITRYGEPVAEIVPPSVAERTESWIGSARGTGKIVGDIVAPATAASDWKALDT